MATHEVRQRMACPPNVSRFIMEELQNGEEGFDIAFGTGGVVGKITPLSYNMDL